MRFIVFIIIFIIWGFIAKEYAAPVTPSMVEYTFWGGFFHGASWLFLQIAKWFGAQIRVFADFHTWWYTVGFILGCFVGFIVFISTIAALSFRD